MPEAATLLQRAQLLAALSVGGEITALRDCGRRLGFGDQLGAALTAIARGDSTLAAAHLARLDAVLALRAGTDVDARAVLRARGRILALSATVTEHAAYFDGGAVG